MDRFFDPNMNLVKKTQNEHFFEFSQFFAPEKVVTGDSEWCPWCRDALSLRILYLYEPT